MKWMAENFLAAWALHEAWTSADTLCLLPAASADTANDTTRAVASVEIRSFFMFVSPLPPNAIETLNRAASFRIFSCRFVQKHDLGRAKAMARQTTKRTWRLDRKELVTQSGSGPHDAAVRTRSH